MLCSGLTVIVFRCFFFRGLFRLSRCFLFGSSRFFFGGRFLRSRFFRHCILGNHLGRFFIRNFLSGLLGLLFRALRRVSCFFRFRSRRRRRCGQRCGGVQGVNGKFRIGEETFILDCSADAVGDIKREFIGDVMLAAQIFGCHCRCVSCAEDVIYLAAMAVSAQEIIGQICGYLLGCIRGMAYGDDIAVR